MITAMPRDISQYPDRCYMAEISKELSRDRSTVVTWDTRGWLPDGLAFHRDENGWRYWTREQLEKAREWVNSPQRRRAPKSMNAA